MRLFPKKGAWGGRRWPASSTNDRKLAHFAEPTLCQLRFVISKLASSTHEQREKNTTGSGSTLEWCLLVRLNSLHVDRGQLHGRRGLDASGDHDLERNVDATWRSCDAESAGRLT